MLEERARKLERKDNPATPIYSCVGCQASSLSKDKGLGPPVTARHSTSKGCPRLPCRDTTERNKAKLSPWTLSGAASAQADRPRTARRKATRESGAKALSAGQRDESASCRAVGAIVPLAPSAHGHVLSPEQKTKRHAPRITLPAGALLRPTSYHIRRAGAQARQAGARHRPFTSWGKIAESPFGRIP